MRALSAPNATLPFGQISVGGNSNNSRKTTIANDTPHPRTHTPTHAHTHPPFFPLGSHFPKLLDAGKSTSNLIQKSSLTAQPCGASALDAAVAKKAANTKLASAVVSLEDMLV